MKKKFLITFLLLPLSTFAFSNDAKVDIAKGETLYNQLCVNCHALGNDGAPRLGVKEDWTERLPMGLETLYQAVIEGPNHMSSKGNSPIESKGEISNMIAYMMSSVTDDETRPLINSASDEDKARHLRLNNGYKNYDLVCNTCHDDGIDGAPRIGNVDDWKGRQDKDLDDLTNSIINGKGHMATRAMTANMSAAEYRNMVEYMLNELD